MINEDQNIISAIDHMVAGETLSAKLPLTKVYSMLELITAIVLGTLASYYFTQGNIIIGGFLCFPVVIITYNVFAIRFKPSLALNQTAHYWMLSTGLCLGLLWFGLDGAYWAIPIVASSFYVIPLKHALYLSGAITLYLIGIAPLFNDITTAFRAITILILASGSTALYSIALRKQQQTLALRSITDPLTGAFNRLYLNHTLEKLLKLQGEHRISSTIALLDINNFKHVNTTYGHDGGDKALIRLVEIAKAYIPTKYPLFRYGGDEFIIVFEACDQDEAENYINLIQKALQHLMHKPQEIPISFSSGFASTHADSTLEDLLNICDRAMYQEKGVQLA